MIDWVGTHIFSNFGSGTLQRIPTYWSPFCIVDPNGLLNEYEILRNIGVEPIIFLDERCPVTTPLEFMINRTLATENGHGSCGVGVGQTFQREEEHYSLTVGDLQYPWVLKTKLQLLDKYYTSHPNYPIIESDFDADDFDGFIEDCTSLVKLPSIKIVRGMRKTAYDHVIFEGA
jgi:adenylosuccinate synthase